MATATIDDYISSLEEPLTSVAVTLRDHLDAALTAATGKIWHGHPVWMSGSQPVAGFKAYPNYVTLMLWQGQDIDSDGALEPSGSGRMATMKVSGAAYIHGPVLRKWLTEVNQLSPAQAQGV